MRLVESTSSRTNLRASAPRSRRSVAPCTARAALLTSLALICAALPALGQASTNQEKTAPAAPPVTKSIVVKDEAGRTVTVPQPVRRIVSLAPSVTETLFALGADDRLVGVTDFCDYPPEALKKTKVGGSTNPSLEQIVALRPDIVLMTSSANRIQTMNALEGLKIAAYGMDERSVQGVLGSIGRMAEVIGSPDEGKTLVASLQARLAEVHRRLTGVTPARVLFVVWQAPLISVGHDTFLADALRAAGAESVIQTRQDWPHVSLEEVVHLQPEYIIFAAAHSDEGPEDLASLRAVPAWRELKAVQEGHVVVVSDAINRPAPRLIDAIEDLARQLHPEAFVDAPHAVGAAHEKSGSADHLNEGTR